MQSEDAPQVASAPVIEVFADLWCPFTHVGLRAVVDERHRLGRDDVVLRVRPWPLELVNGEPMSFAKTKEHAEDLVAQVSPGLFTGLAESTFPSSTLEALAMVEAAYRHDARLGERVSLGLRDALFEEGCDLSDPGELARCGARLAAPPVSDADRAAVRAALDEGRARGVQGSPHFFCGDTDSFCPALEIRRDAEGALHVDRSQDALRAFVGACLVD